MDYSKYFIKKCTTVSGCYDQFGLRADAPTDLRELINEEYKGNQVESRHPVTGFFYEAFLGHEIEGAHRLREHQYIFTTDYARPMFEAILHTGDYDVLEAMKATKKSLKNRIDLKVRDFLCAPRSGEGLFHDSK